MSLDEFGGFDRTDGELVVPRGMEQTNEPLRECVRVAMEQYFVHMSGYRPKNVYRMVMDEVERPLFESVMRHCGGNQSRAAEVLGISRGTLRKKLGLYDIR